MAYVEPKEILKKVRARTAAGRSQVDAENKARAADGKELPPRDHNGHGQRTASPRIHLIPFDEIRLGTTRRDLVKGLIPRVGLTVIWGPPKCGKSFWTFDTMMHVVLGWPYRCRRVHQGPVVYCAFEGQTGFEARVAAFRQRFLASHIGKVPFYLEPVTLDLVRDHRALIAAIRSQLGDDKPVAVVLDTLNRSIRGSESSDEDMTAYVNAADAIRTAFECAVIIVHHCGIDGTRPRGHTSLTGTCAAQLATKRDAANKIVVTIEWMKDGPDGDVIASELKVETVGKDEDGEDITSCVVVPTDAQTSSKRDIPKSARTAFELLEKAIEDTDEPAPTSNHIPRGTRTSSICLWRRYCYAGMVAESDKPDSKQKAFVRSVKKLQEIGAIGIWGNYVWITGQAGQGRTTNNLSGGHQAGQTRTPP